LVSFVTNTRSPALSLIVSTKGRKAQFQHLMRSLELQTCSDFELIVVEQNPEVLLSDILGRDRDFPVQHIHTPQEQGASRGRNRGLEAASGEYVLFPDDDCWYPPNLLKAALEQMAKLGLDALTGRPTDLEGKTIDGRFEPQAQWISRANVWTTQIEWLAFWRRKLVETIGGFDEMVGVGALSPWQSAEGQDLMLRALRAGARCRYDPELNGHSAGVNKEEADEALWARARSYGRGMGYVMRKHRIGVVTAGNYLFRPAAGATLGAVRGNLQLAKFYTETAIGRIEGLRGRCFS
jgi:glycosyltransferase involved in cell wall biosynthesis